MKNEVEEIANDSLIWLAILVLFTLAMFLTVPVANITRLMLFGLTAGLGLGLVVMGFMDPLLQLSRYKYAAIPGFFGIPVIPALTWLPVEIIFANYFSKMETKTQAYLYVLGFSVGAATFDYVCILLGIREFIKWNLFKSFLVALIIHIGLGYYLLVTSYARKKIS